MVQDMNKKLKATSLPGRPSPDVAPYEAAHRETARIAAEEGFVLLKNEHGILPLAKNSKLALYGAGVSNPIKGGTGSGDVNTRSMVNIEQVMRSPPKHGSRASANSTSSPVSTGVRRSGKQSIKLAAIP